jgi:hypothetical protein
LRIYPGGYIWRVEFESKRAEDEVLELTRTGNLTREDQEVIRAWINKISDYGPEAISSDRTWADHELREEPWIGYRATCFSNRGRILYKVKDKVVTIAIARITTTHDYRKRGDK